MLTINGYHINKNNIQNNKLTNIKKDLTVKPYSFMKKKPIYYTLYTETADQLIIPKFYALKIFGGGTYENKLKLVKTNINFKGELRDYQINIVNLCMDYINKYNGGLLSLGCGKGKTVIALKIASLLNVNTLVIVHKEFLQEQWIERIKSFTDCSPGIIRSNIIDIENKQITVGMINSISKRDYGNIFENFSFVIYDEAHHVPAKIFSKTLQKTGALYTLALSATPYRTDGLFKILHWYIGDTIYRENIIHNKAVCVKIINFNSNKLSESTMLFNGESKPHFTKMITDLCHIESRIKLIAKIINILIQQNRKIIILSGRIEHLNSIKKKVDKYVIKKKLTYKIFYYIGNMNKKERLEAEQNGDVLFSTYDMAHEALDIPRLNTAILATPKKDVIQSIGRIQRTTLVCGDMRPLIIDIKDNLPIFNKHGAKRELLYKKSKYTIQKYNCEDGTFDEKLKHIVQLDPVTDDLFENINEGVNEKNDENINQNLFIKYK